MKKLLILLLVFFAHSFFGMKPAEKRQKIAEMPMPSQAVVDASAIERVPVDVLALILKEVAAEGKDNEEKLKNAVKSIRSVMASSQRLWQMRLSRDLNGMIVKELAKRYTEGNVVKAAVVFGTVGAGQWLALQATSQAINNVSKWHDWVRQTLKEAVEKGNVGAVKFLGAWLEPLVGKVVNESDEYSLLREDGTFVKEITIPLFKATNDNNLVLVRILLKIGAKEELEICLDEAIRNGSIEIATELLNAGTDLNSQSLDGDTALMIACDGGHENIVRELLSRGADVNVRAARGDTVLMRVAGERDARSAEIIKLLLKAGAHINDKNYDGYTALMRTIGERGNLEAMMVLLNAGADVNIQTNIGQTALMGAIYFSKLDAVKALLRAGADVYLKDENGRTALDIAKESKSAYKQEIIQLLEQHMKAGHEKSAKK